MVDEGLGLNDYSTIMLNLQVTTETEGGREGGKEGFFRSCEKKKIKAET